ncbi:hypothetical protein [Caproicibacter fermentans]|uniref:DUF2383 domain-containing protein n=1 Tax=Caproicibacter fermentans TaxID=2576756 RepID=A0A7G8TC01_9FIRM|nr:hypothetical protein [Caproicibacter fermentans]QNK41142.1 hypothetical protein HCR03_02185 [Caproicibacter fermentans]
MRRDKKRNLIVNELFRVSRLSMEAAELVLPLVKDESLKYQVQRQQELYHSTAAKSAEILRRNGLHPEEEPGLMERVLRDSIKMDTSWNKSSPHIAQIAIHCTDAAMKDLVKSMNRSADDDTESRKLAEEYLTESQKNIELLKMYL